MLGSILKKNKKIYGISAPSRSTTLINYFGINEDMLDCILEIKGSYKIGKYVPGTKIPIYEESSKNAKYSVRFEINGRAAGTRAPGGTG